MKPTHSPLVALVVSAASLALTACSSNPPAATNPVSLGASILYVPQNIGVAGNTAPEILGFAANATGNPTPITTLTLPTSLAIGNIATDPSGNLYVATSIDIREYAAGATGNATPLRVIPSNATTTLAGNPTLGLAADASGTIYVAEAGSNAVAVFSGTANGSVPPTRLITGTQTQLQDPANVAVDKSGNLYVSSISSVFGGAVCCVYVFTSAENGNVAPTRAISTSSPVFTVDGAGNVYNFYIPTGVASPTIAEFAAGSGSSTPARTIAGSSTSLGEVRALTVDAAGDIYAVTWGNPLNNVLPANPTVLTFAAGATGNATPASTFTPASWNGPTSIAVY